jgi:hypothetical protein
MSDTHEVPRAIQVALPDAQRLSPMVAAAMASGPTPDVLRELLAVQREWEAGEARRAYTMALVDLKRDLPAVIDRDTVVDYSGAKGRTRYAHASLAGVMQAVTEPLARHGFSLAWTPETTAERLVTVTARLTHREGHAESCTISAPPDTSGSKSPAQAVASTITLLSRYSALALLGIATADMREDRDAEPEDPEAVDQARNLRAAAAIRARGILVEEAEAQVGSESKDWTAADLATLRAWLAGR